MRAWSPAPILLAVLLMPQAPRGAAAALPLTPTRVAPITNAALLLRAIPDGAGGAFVAWQEDSALTVRALHLMADGSLDSAWPPVVTVCGTPATRKHLGLVADDLGGVYVWWSEGAGGFVTRVTPDGAIAAEWPVRAGLVRGMSCGQAGPCVVSDSRHGIYIGGSGSRIRNGTFQYCAMLAHLGPDRLGAGGSPDTAVALSPNDSDPPNLWSLSLLLEPTADGEVWAVVGSMLYPGTVDCWRVLRFGQDCRPSTGWDERGRILQDYPSEYSSQYDLYMAMMVDWRAAGAVRDINDGILVSLTERDDSGWYVTHLYRINSLGDLVRPRVEQYGWLTTSLPYDPDSYVDGDLTRYSRTGSGALLAGGPTVWWIPTCYPPTYGFLRSSEGGWPNERLSFAGDYADYAPLSDGEAYVASCTAYGWCGPCLGSQDAISGCVEAGLSVVHTGRGTIFQESIPNPVDGYGLMGRSYGALTMVSIAPNTPWLIWSQVRDRVGLFQMELPEIPLGQLSSDSAVVAVGVPTLVVRYVRGAGIEMVATLTESDRAQLLVADVTGRVVARTTLQGGRGVRRWSVAESSRLPSGIYFARLQQGTKRLTARVIVTR